MMVHEFQAKELLSCYGLVSPGGKVAITGQEAENIARGFSSGSIVVKAQVHAGGRGRAGGVIVVNSPEQAKSAAEKMLGQRLVTDQTGPLGRMTKRVYIERDSGSPRAYDCLVGGYNHGRVRRDRECIWRRRYGRTRA